jgi:uncharacterized phage protein (TIGR02218 family)
MRTVPAAITTARQSASSRLCKIWRIERTDGTVLRFTEHDRDLTVAAETFLATASFDPSAIKVTADLSVGDLDVQGAFDSAHITAADLLAGRYSGASFWVAEVLWDNTTAGKDIQKFGWLGTIREVGGKFVAELLDPSSRLQMPILRMHGAACDATLGDARCGVSLVSHTQTGTVTSAANQRVFDASDLSLPSGDDEYFVFGKVTWTSGLNDGLSMDVQSCDGTTVSLFLPMPFAIAEDDTFTIVAGCNRSLGACRYKFDNVLNHRGKPHVPVTDDVIKGLVKDEDGVGLTDPLVDDGGGG